MNKVAYLVGYVKALQARGFLKSAQGAGVGGLAGMLTNENLAPLMSHNISPTAMRKAFPTMSDAVYQQLLQGWGTGPYGKVESPMATLTPSQHQLYAKIRPTAQRKRTGWGRGAGVDEITSTMNLGNTGGL